MNRKRKENNRDDASSNYSTRRIKNKWQGKIYIFKYIPFHFSLLTEKLVINGTLFSCKRVQVTHVHVR